MTRFCSGSLAGLCKSVCHKQKRLERLKHAEALVAVQTVALTELRSRGFLAHWPSGAAGAPSPVPLICWL